MQKWGGTKDNCRADETPRVFCAFLVTVFPGTGQPGLELTALPYFPTCWRCEHKASIRGSSDTERERKLRAEGCGKSLPRRKKQQGNSREDLIAQHRDHRLWMQMDYLQIPLQSPTTLVS